MTCGHCLPKKKNYRDEKPDPTELEKRHINTIDAAEKVKKDGSLEIKIEFAKLLAPPDEPTHSNKRIEFYYGDTFLARANYSGGQVTIKLITW